MRCLLALLLVLGMNMKSPAAVFVYVSKAPEEEIQIYKLNPADGSLSEVETVKVGGQPGAIGFDLIQQFHGFDHADRLSGLDRCALFG